MKTFLVTDEWLTAITPDELKRILLERVTREPVRFVYDGKETERMSEIPGQIRFAA